MTQETPVTLSETKLTERLVVAVSLHALFRHESWAMFLAGKWQL